MLANVASRLLPISNLVTNNFYIEFILRPSILDNITNWKVFYNDAKILQFLTSEDTLKDSAIDDEQHEKVIQGKASDHEPGMWNTIPKYIARLEKYFDLKDKLKKVTNCQIKSSSMQYEVINLVTEKNPHNVNLGRNKMTIT
jgi:hypothetical protein